MFAERNAGEWTQLDMPAFSRMVQFENVVKHLTCEAALEYVNGQSDVKSNERLSLAFRLPLQLNARGKMIMSWALAEPEREVRKK